jgi:hypothetical protein
LTLTAAKKHVPKRVEGDLVYYTVRVFGGKEYKNEGTGQRTKQVSSFSNLCRSVNKINMYAFSTLKMQELSFTLVLMGSALL